MVSGDRAHGLTRTAAAATDLLVGVAAGLAAAGAMSLFQEAAAWAVVKPPSGKTAATKAADTASECVSGAPVKPSVRKKADSIVHYLTGAVMGGAYGLLGGAAPVLTRGYGLPYGAGAWLLGDEIAVPFFHLGPPPSRTRPGDHALALASHLVFGLVLDGVRRKLNQAISPRP